MRVEALRSRDPVLRHAGLQVLARTPGIRSLKLTGISQADLLLAGKRSAEHGQIVKEGHLKTAIRSKDPASWAIATKWIADEMLTEYQPLLESQLDIKLP